MLDPDPYGIEITTDPKHWYIYWLNIDWLPGEGLGDDGPAAEEPGLERCVLPGAPLPVVLVSHHHPVDS